MERGSSFGELRRLATCFDKLDARAARRSIQRLGGLALPLLLRELAGESAGRAELARGLIGGLAGGDAELRARAVRGLQSLSASTGMGGAGAAGAPGAPSRASGDDIKARALGLLGELGVTAASATFSDPDAVQR